MKHNAIVSLLIMGSSLAASAQEMQITYTSEFQYSPTANTANWCNLLRTHLRVPTSENGGIEVATITIYRANRNRVVTDLMTFSNIEEETTPLAIALLGYSQRVGASEFFAGIRNMNQDYFASPVTSLFTNSSCGIFPTISTNYPIANYPLAALCIDYRTRWDNWALEGSLYNGVGRNGWSKEDNPFIINLKKDGIFLLSKVDYTSGSGQYFLGSAIANRLPNSPQGERWSVTLWGYAEERLWQSQRDQIYLLAQYSHSFPSEVFCRDYAALGMVWSRQHQGVAHHNAGITLSAAKFRNNYEFATEITYRYTPCSAAMVQPTLHLIKNGSGFSSVFLLRLSCSLGRDF